MSTLDERIERLTGSPPVGSAPLSGGCVGDVRHVRLANGESVVVKSGGRGDALAVEGWMLRTLRERANLPVPDVIYADDGVLIIEFIEAGDPITPAAETHAAELLAGLHGVSDDRYGLDRDTVIGGLTQPNAPADSWIEFFRDRRLLYMAREAHVAGRLPDDVMRRIERFAARLDARLVPPEKPSLIHGDMWGGNVLVRADRIAAFVDPAIYFADPEIELAFSTLFSTFGEPFFRRYGEIAPLRPGFFETRRDLYNLYPLLVHVRLFGGGYVGAVERVLRGLGA